MRKEAFEAKLFENGDSYIYYTSPISKKSKYHIGTNIFSRKISPYIYDRYMKIRSTVESTDNQVLIFCWDLDDFKLINVDHVNNIVPLNSILK